MSSLFPPREPAVPEPGDWELNRSRVEMRFISGCEPTDPEQVGFPSARQVASLNRQRLPSSLSHSKPRRDQRKWPVSWPAFKYFHR
jgi:hypothetical protein